VCGDGFKQAGEECDDGDNNNDNACLNNCKLRCGNKVLDSGEACDDGNANAFFCDSTCKRSGLVVFVTSQKYSGDLDGLEGADAKCNSAAAGLIGAGTYVAWVSDQTDDAEDRTIPAPNWQTLPYRTLNGKQVVDHFWNALGLENPINVTQSGQLLADGGDTCETAAEVRVWTGTTNSGDWWGPGSDCDAWTYGFNGWPPADKTGLQGRADKIDGSWTASGGCDCKTSARLYCIETPK